jgi:hypothetical protein
MGHYVEPLSYKISAYLSSGDPQKALKIVAKAACNERILKRIITESESDWQTFSTDDDAIWCFNEIYKVSKNKHITEMAFSKLVIFRNRKALHLIYKDNIADAQKILVQSLEEKMEDGYTRLFYSLLLRKMGSTQQSDEELEKHVNSTLENGYAEYAFFLDMAGMDSDAQFFFQKALKKPKDPLNTYKGYLAYLRRKEKFTEMLEYCDKINKIIPNHPRTFSDRAFALKGLGRYKEAIGQLWCCIEHADMIEKDITVKLNDLTWVKTYTGRENYKRLIARDICNLVTFQMNNTTTNEIERIKKYFNKEYNWTMFYNGCIWYIQARNFWYSREWEKANEAFYRAETRFDMCDELGADGHTILIWRLFSTDRELNELFSEFDILERQEILEKIERLSKSKKEERVSRDDNFGQMINGYYDCIDYLNSLLNFFRDRTVIIDKNIFARIRLAFANNDFAAGFDTIDALRKIEMCIARYLKNNSPSSKREKAQFYDKCWVEIEQYLSNAINTMNGPSMYQMVRSSDKQVYSEYKTQITVNEPSMLFGSETEKEIINIWRKFRDAQGITKKSIQEYQTLVKQTTDLWVECNEVAKQNNWKDAGYVFKPTNKVSNIPLTLNNTIIKNRDDFAQFIKLVYLWIVEASSNSDRLPNNQETTHYVELIKEFRNHSEHDREHGKQTDVKKKYMIIAAYFEEIIGKQPFRDIDWWLLQLGILLRTKAILTLTLNGLASKESM